MDILIEEAGESLWVAALDKGVLQGLEIDPAGEKIRWGSIYQGKVKTIDAALDAAFLDLGDGRTGILYNKDLRLPNKDGSYKKGGEKAIGKTLKTGDFLIVQAKSAYLPKPDDSDRPMEDKIPQMSMDITLPGRYLIYSPLMNENRISMRINEKKSREKLRAMLDELSDLKGCILRAAALNTQTDVLMREGKILGDVWKNIQDSIVPDRAYEIMLGPDAIQRTLSDQATKPIQSIEVVIMDHFQKVEAWCSIFAPDMVPKVKPVELENATEDFALFDYRDIMGQIEALFQKYTFLTSGGNIIIQHTAAFTAIDVNKGRDKRGHLDTNIEAAIEIFRQIRLRNIGGAVIVDFLNMQSKKDKDNLIKKMKALALTDPCTIQIHGFTSLELLEITRKRRTPSLEDRL